MKVRSTSASNSQSITSYIEFFIVRYFVRVHLVSSDTIAPSDIDDKIGQMAIELKPSKLNLTLCSL